MTERTRVKWILRDSEETYCLFKVQFWSSMTPSVLVVSANGMGWECQLCVGDATGGKVRRRYGSRARARPL